MKLEGMLLRLGAEEVRSMVCQHLLSEDHSVLANFLYGPCNTVSFYFDKGDLCISGYLPGHRPGVMDEEDEEEDMSIPPVLDPKECKSIAQPPQKQETEHRAVWPCDRQAGKQPPRSSQ